MFLLCGKIMPGIEKESTFVSRKFVVSNNSIRKKHGCSKGNKVVLTLSYLIKEYSFIRLQC